MKLMSRMPSFFQVAIQNSTSLHPELKIGDHQVTSQIETSDPQEVLKRVLALVEK